jgi:hypothetical protein
MSLFFGKGEDSSGFRLAGGKGKETFRPLPTYASLYISLVKSKKKKDLLTLDIGVFTLFFFFREEVERPKRSGIFQLAMTFLI